MVGLNTKSANLDRTINFPYPTDTIQYLLKYAQQSVGDPTLFADSPPPLSGLLGNSTN